MIANDLCKMRAFFSDATMAPIGGQRQIVYARWRTVERAP